MSQVLVDQLQKHASNLYITSLDYTLVMIYNCTVFAFFGFLLDCTETIDRGQLYLHHYVILVILADEAILMVDGLLVGNENFSGRNNIKVIN